MSGIITTGNHPKLLWPGVNQIIDDIYATYKGEFNLIFDTSVSDRRYEDDVSIAGMGLPSVKSEGDAIAFDSFGQGFVSRYVHVVYGKGFAVTQEALEDIQYGISLAAKGAAYLANGMLQNKEIVAANILNDAFTGGVGGDGKVLLTTDHPLAGAGGTFANELSVAADLSEASLEQAAMDIAGLVDDAGLRIALMADRLIVPRQLMFEACRLLKSESRPGSADNDINAISSMSAIPGGYAVNHYLDDENAWFIKVKGLAANQGMRHFTRAGYKLEMDNDFTTKNLLTTATERYSFGWSNPRAMFGSPGA